MCPTCNDGICTNRCASTDAAGQQDDPFNVSTCPSCTAYQDLCPNCERLIIEPHPIPGAVGDEEPIRMENEPAPRPLEQCDRAELINRIHSLGNQLEMIDIARKQEALFELELRDMLAAALKDGGVVAEIRAERQRQITAEGWTQDHDDKYDCGDLASAAACYATQGRFHFPQPGKPGPNWPWAPEWWKPSSYRRNLIKAAALIVAEIERFDRAESKEATHA